MTRILWLTPNTPNSVSVGRHEIAIQLGDMGYDVTQKQARPSDLKTLHHYDCIIGTTRRGALLGQLGIGVPFIVDHVDPISQFYETQNEWLARLVDVGERVAFRRASHVLYVYDEARKRVPGNKATQTTLGVDYHAFYNPDTRVVEQAEKHLGDVKLNYALYIGGLEPRYNIISLLSSVDLLDRELVIIGDGSLRGEVERASEAIENLHYLGTKPYRLMPGFMELASVGLSLVNDGHTCKVLEYGAAGLPVVQLKGKAGRVLPQGITYTDLRPESIAESVREAEYCPELQEYSAKRDYIHVARDYAAAIDEVIQ